MYFFLACLLLLCSDNSSIQGSNDTNYHNSLQTFENFISEVGIGEIGFRGQTAVWGDFNNDGCLDLFVANTDFDSPNVFLFRSNCDGTFHNVTSGEGLRHTPLRSASLTDFDNDGFMDVFLNGHIGMALMENSGTDSNFLILTLIGDGVFTNTSAIGTRVEVDTSSGGIQIREVSGGEGCCSQDMLPVHFGLGKDRLADIVVQWPGGGSCFFENLDVNGGLFLIIFQDGCDTFEG